MSAQPRQHQDRQPGHEAAMQPRPEAEMRGYTGSGKLQGKVCIVTGGDSGIGRAVAIGFAKEGADVLIAYLDEHEDAVETCRLIEAAGRRCVAMAGDLGDAAHGQRVVERAIAEFGKLDVVVSNAAEQHPKDSLADIDAEQLEHTFRTNVFAMFHVLRAALPHLKEGARIITTTSVTAYRGSGHLWRSHAHWPSSWRSAASWSTQLPPGRSGHRSFPRRSMPDTLPRLGPSSHWGVPGNPMRLLLATSFWHRQTPVI